MLKQIAENLNANPANADMAAEQKSINASEGNTESNDAKSAREISHTAASFASPTLEGPEFDFSQNIKEVSDIQNITTPVIIEKQQKRIVKDSNLIN